MFPPPIQLLLHRCQPLPEYEIILFSGASHTGVVCVIHAGGGVLTHDAGTNSVDLQAFTTRDNITAHRICFH
ncbi:hypothetical protein AFK65_08530 [Cronobacter universalis NCTC 9529]|uniref:Uncharacterized protein n=1 Tax=Cronobacter universalis NCTC 9529 TaxID=1074000 RepID=A0AAC8VPZ6_9ENTR|nr:hypothetical protein AFK65_08530 [Cronobacter universalis NCTC 9529]